MLFTDYLDSIENTADAEIFFGHLATLRDDLVLAERVPIAGKIIKALVALSDIGDIAEFRRSSHYQHIEGFDITVHPGGLFSIYPGYAQRKKIYKVLGVVAAIVIAFVIYRKCCPRRR